MIWILIPIAALKGFHKGSIIYDTVNNLWKVIDASPSNDLKIGKDYKTLAVQKPLKPSDILPVLLHEWTISDTNCNGTRKLMLTVVST